jgi:hypothetical protein
MHQTTAQDFTAKTKAAPPAISLVSDLAEVVMLKRLMATMEAFMTADDAADQPAFARRAA